MSGARWPADAELDALDRSVHARVFGADCEVRAEHAWVRCQNSLISKCSRCDAYTYAKQVVGGVRVPVVTCDVPWPCKPPVPRYSDEIAEAWRVVEALTDFTGTGARIVDGFPAATLFIFRFEKARLWAMSASQAARAICKLALEVSP